MSTDELAKRIPLRYGLSPGMQALGPVILPALLYDRAEAQGIDMRGYVRQERILEG